MPGGPVHSFCFSAIRQSLSGRGACTLPNASGSPHFLFGFWHIARVFCISLFSFQTLARLRYRRERRPLRHLQRRQRELRASTNAGGRERTTENYESSPSIQKRRMRGAVVAYVQWRAWVESSHTSSQKSSPRGSWFRGTFLGRVLLVIRRLVLFYRAAVDAIGARSESLLAHPRR